MAERKARPLLIPLLLLVILLGGLIVISFIPLAQCRQCMGDAIPVIDGKPYSWSEGSAVQDERLLDLDAKVQWARCTRCNSRGNVPVLHNWLYDSQDVPPLEELEIIKSTK